MPATTPVAGPPREELPISEITAHAGEANAAAYAATHSYDVVFTVSAGVLLIGSLVVGALARGRLPALVGAGSPRGILRRVGEAS